MSRLVVGLALFSHMRVADSDLSRGVKTPPSKPHSSDRYFPGPVRPPPLPAVPLPGYVLMTAPSSGHFEPDNDLEVMHEFKLRIEARREMCMFQKVRQNARLYVSFKVRTCVG